MKHVLLALAYGLIRLSWRFGDHSPRRVRVIGVIGFGASSNFMGIYMGEKGFNAVFGEPELSMHFVALTDPDNSRQAARAIESALSTTGVQADSLQQIADENNALSRSFLYLMQAFMGLGLVVGIAAIGVIAFRTVVERRQQIGMLRALGFQREMVSWVFLIESSFVALLGIGLGVSLALIPASQMITDMAAEISGLTFQVPWTEIVFVSGLAYAMTLLTTWLPAVQASQVRPAEALRYE